MWGQYSQIYLWFFVDFFDEMWYNIIKEVNYREEDLFFEGGHLNTEKARLLVVPH